LQVASLRDLAGFTLEPCNLQDFVNFISICTDKLTKNLTNSTRGPNHFDISYWVTDRTGRSREKGGCDDCVQSFKASQNHHMLLGGDPSLSVRVHEPPRLPRGGITPYWYGVCVLDCEKRGEQTKNATKKQTKNSGLNRHRLVHDGGRCFYHPSRERAAPPLLHCQNSFGVARCRQLAICSLRIGVEPPSPTMSAPPLHTILCHTSLTNLADT
jgi:hypothetical protein